MEKNFSSERRVKEILEVYQKVRSHVTTSLVSSREEPPQSRLLFSYGEHHRVWPLADSKNGVLYATVSQVRQSAEPVCKLLRSLDYGKSWNEIADFYAMDERNTTTGQPFVARDGSVFVPVWNAGFYRNGVLWLAIYKSVDGGISWLKTFEDSQGSYGNHFFQSPEGNLYLGVGQGGGGSKGKVNFRPEKSYLLLSRDLGENWETILDVNYPTALYSGVALDNELLLVAAREKKSLFLSLDGGRTWKETRLGHTARNVSYLEGLRKIVVSSNSALFISEDAIKWSKLNTPIKGLIMRYPTWYKGRLYMSAVGWHSYIVSTDLDTWALDFDVTKATGSNLGARMAILNDSIFIGDEANGTLIRARLPFNSDIPIDLFQQLKGNLDYLAFIAKYVIKRII